MFNHAIHSVCGAWFRILVEARTAALLAKNGVEALQLIESEEHIDLGIFDIRMDRMDGLETMGRIKQKDISFPMIINTAYPEYRQDFKSWAANAFFIKSGDLTELKEKVKELLENAPANE